MNDKISMTKEQLTSTIEILLSCAVSKLTDHFPDAFSITERQSMTGGYCTDMSMYERGIVQQSIWSIACLTAQTIDDGVGEGDTATMLGGFMDKCELFISSNWRGYGHHFLERLKEAKEKTGGVSYKMPYLFYPDTKTMAKNYIAYFEDSCFSHAVGSGPQSA